VTPYELFASYYDGLMRDIDYQGRAVFFSQLFERFHTQPQIVLDLACGTGSLSVELSKLGYDVIGVDRSPAMLSAASAKAGSTNGSVLFLCQEMGALDLYGTIDAAVCHLDGINHLLSKAAVCAAFEKVSLFLNEGGLFVFDLNSPRKLAQELGNNTYVYDDENVYCVWQNSYSSSTRVCRFDLTFFERRGAVYSRRDERFAEKAYTTQQIKSWLALSGLTLAGVFDGFSFDEANENSSRILFVAMKGKSGWEN
jgi:SAM-dependent methyltransferase